MPLDITSKIEITVRFFVKMMKKLITNLLEEMMFVPEFVALYEIIPYSTESTKKPISIPSKNMRLSLISYVFFDFVILKRLSLVN